MRRKDDFLPEPKRQCYCVNCKHWAGVFTDGFCGWCLKFFYKHGHMPQPGETDPEPSSIDKLWAQIDQMESA